MINYYYFNRGDKVVCINEDSELYNKIFIISSTIYSFNNNGINIFLRFEKNNNTIDINFESSNFIKLKNIRELKLLKLKYYDRKTNV